LDWLRKIWNGPFYVGPLKPPITFGEALLKLLEVAWRGLLIAIGVVVLVVVWLDLQSRVEGKQAAERRNSQRIVVQYDPAACGRELPLRMYINNNLNERVLSHEINIGARQPGQSSNLVGYRDRTLSSDFIVEPRSTVEVCWGLIEWPANREILDYDATVASFQTEQEGG